jgi:asparagine N-glycosylation enzyme membrane subunit Stt3
MRKFGKESTAPAEGVGRESGKGWLQNHCALVVCLIAVIALLLRTVFAYGVSADSGFALSGGSTAQYHLHVVESILNGSYVLGSDVALNYPVGGLNVNPPLYDFIAAGLGSVTSASTALAVLAPIFGALTVFPVFLVGKEFRDYKVGLLAAFIYGFMALPICSTVLSNGNEYGFAAFLVAFFFYALIKMAKKISADEFAKKEVVIAGLLLALVALSWNGFRALLVMMIIIMVIQMLIDRFNSKDFSVTLYSYSLVMLIGVGIAAVYYIPANLWDAVFSGPVLITVIAIVFGFIFKALQTKPWLFVVPGLIIAFAVIAVVLNFVAPDLCTALIFGNSSFLNPVMEELANVGISISKMSSYYGWLLMWMPAALGIYEFYKYARKDRSHMQLFYTMWLLVLWIFSWTSFAAAAIFGPIYAISSAAVIIGVLRKVDLKSYFAGMKGAGFPGIFKKIFKPVPFISVIIVVFLVAVPGFINSVDAGISSNETYGYFGYGNTVYTIETGDKYPATQIYDDLEATGDKSKAVVSWIDYSADIEARGFNTVNDMYGDGASAAAQIYLAKGSAGVTAAQIVRIMYANPTVDFSSCFIGFANVFGTVNDFIKDPATAKTVVLGDSDKYGSLSSDISNENAIYIASVEAITSAMGTSTIMDTYESVCSKANQNIGYYIVDGSMVPLMYGDGSSLSTISYFAGHNIDENGAPKDYFYYLTYYSNYYPAYAYDALYDTFLWKALIGPSPSEAGYSSSFSYLYALTTSDGTVKAMPGYGLAGYEIASWYVKYNPASNATTADSGWKYMSYEKARELQLNDGGLINYLSSIIMLEYTGYNNGLVTNQVVDEAGEPLEGITVQVNAYNSVYGSNTVYSETKTDANGHYSAIFPVGTGYMVVYKSGTVKLEPTYSGNKVIIDSARFVGEVTLGENVDKDGLLYVLEKDGKQIFIESDHGIINSDDACDKDMKKVLITPGTYSYELRNDEGTAVASGSVTLYSGYNSGLTVTPTSYTITATVVDFFGRSVENAMLVATNSDNGNKYDILIEKGTAVLYVPSGTYTVEVTGGYISINTTSLNVTSNRTVSITAYPAFLCQVHSAPSTYTVYGGSFSGVGLGNLSIELPASIGATEAAYTFYGYDGTSVYYGVYNSAGEVTFESSKAYKVTGSIGGEGTIDFATSNGGFVRTTAGSDGKFTVYLMAGSYTMHAYNSSNKVFLDSVTVNADTDVGTKTLVDGKKVTITYNYASRTSKSNVSIPFAPATITFKHGNGVYNLTDMTDSTGKVTFVIPQDATTTEVKINGGSIDSKAFKYDSLSVSIDSGTSDVTKTLTIPATSLVDRTVTLDYDMTLTPYSGGDNIEGKKGQTVTIPSGQYTAKVSGSTGFYFSGTVYMYPGDDKLSGLNVTEVFGVKIIKGALDVITVEGDKSYYEDGDMYYFEYGCDYYIESSNPSTGCVKYGFISKPTTEDPEVEELDLTTSSRLIEVTGYVGAVATGTVYVTYGPNQTVKADVSSGAFKVNLPSDVVEAQFHAEVTKTVNGQQYGYSGNVTATGLKDGSIVNLTVKDDPVVVDLTDDDLEVEILEANFNKGTGTVELRIVNNSDVKKTYAITAGTAWVLDKSVQVTISPKLTEIVEVVGHYQPEGTGIGSSGMDLIVSDYNGTTSKTVHIIDGNNVPGTNTLSLKTAAECSNKDMVSGSEYLYALTFINDGPTNQATINVNVGTGYTVTLMNEDGALIKENGSTLIIPAMTSYVIYAKVMKTDGALSLPSGISVSATDGNGNTITTGKQVSPSEMSVEVTSMTVSGDSAVDQKSGIPLGVWFIFGVSILLLILIVWMGSKRGVFSRR